LRSEGPKIEAAGQKLKPQAELRPEGQKMEAGGQYYMAKTNIKINSNKKISAAPPRA